MESAAQAESAAAAASAAEEELAGEVESAECGALEIWRDHRRALTTPRQRKRTAARNLTFPVLARFLTPGGWAIRTKTGGRTALVHRWPPMDQSGRIALVTRWAPIGQRLQIAEPIKRAASAAERTREAVAMAPLAVINRAGSRSVQATGVGPASAGVVEVGLAAVGAVVAEVVVVVAAAAAVAADVEAEAVDDHR